MDQYIKFTINYRGKNYTTKATTETNPGENISDNGGMIVGYRAFKKDTNKARNECVPGLPLSANQLFWVRLSTAWQT